MITTSNSTKNTKSKSWSRCLGCWSRVPKGTTLSKCETCIKLSEKVIIPCDCGNTELKIYRNRDFSPRNCIRCIFLGHRKIRTVGQEEAIKRYQLCDGICGLVQPIGRKMGRKTCYDCQAIADVDPILCKKLDEILKTKTCGYSQLGKKSIDSSYSSTLWIGVLAKIEEKLRDAENATTASNLATTMAIIDEQNEKENFLRILRLAQSGKSSKESVDYDIHKTRSTKLQKKKLENTQYSKVSVIIEPKVPSVSVPRASLVSFRCKERNVRKTQSIQSFAEFPPL